MAMSFKVFRFRLKAEGQRWFRIFLTLERQRWEAEDSVGWAERVGALDEVAFMLVESMRHRVLANSAATLVAMEVEIDKFLYGWPGLINEYCDMALEGVLEELRTMVGEKVAFKGLEDDEHFVADFLVEMQAVVARYRGRILECADKVINLVSEDEDLSLGESDPVGEALEGWVESQERNVG